MGTAANMLLCNLHHGILTSGSAHLADAPQMLSDETMMDLAEVYLSSDNRASLVAGIRELALDRHTLSTMGRGDEARQKKRICQQIPFDYTAPREHESGLSRQSLWATAWSMDFGKMNAGDLKDFKVAAQHVDVSIQWTPAISLFLLYVQ